MNHNKWMIKNRRRPRRVNGRIVKGRVWTLLHEATLLVNSCPDDYSFADHFDISASVPLAFHASTELYWAARGVVEARAWSLVNSGRINRIEYPEESIPW